MVYLWPCEHICLKIYMNKRKSSQAQEVLLIRSARRSTVKVDDEYC
jgi:hypothetical protein